MPRDKSRNLAYRRRNAKPGRQAVTLRTLFCMLLLAGCAAPAPEIGSAEPRDGLAAELADRTAGPAQRCVSSHDLRGSRLVRASEAILFEARGDILYVNQPRGGCPGLSDDLALSTRTTTGRLCEGDVVEAFDASSGIGHGACSLGPFTPYRKAP